jgi:hypothetical protein
MTRWEQQVISKWHTAVAWANFGLVVAAVLKFVPILLSFSHGIDLTAEQVESGLDTDRGWAMDLISDTPYLVAVWLLVGLWLKRQTGSAMRRPWQART